MKTKATELQTNKGQRDPIQNRRMTDDCWNGRHGRCPNCGCLCHSKVKRFKASTEDVAAKTMDIMDTGCGTLDIEVGEHQARVLDKFPRAYVYRVGVMKYEIRRPREKSDPQAVVKYVLLSKMFDSPEKAWEGAVIE